MHRPTENGRDFKKTMESLLSAELSPSQRLLVTWAFVAVGLVIAVQISQLPEQRPLAWTRLTKESR
jgi:hypothetical protein